MAKVYRALSNIEHGEEIEQDGQIVNQITRIPFGAVVEGLPADVMKNLWDAGVLEEVETSTPTVTRTTKPVAEQAGGATGGSATPSNPPPAPRPDPVTPPRAQDKQQTQSAGDKSNTNPSPTPNSQDDKSPK